MRKMISGLLVAGIVCGSATTWAAVLPREVAELTAAAQQIVIGDVSEVTSFWDAGHDLIKSRVVVAVGQYLVGTGSGSEVLEMSGGTVEGLTLVVSFLPVFEVGDHVLLFLGDGEIRLVQAFQGAYLTDGVQTARMAPGCRRVLEESVQPLSELVRAIERALPAGTTLPEIAPYSGDFRLPLGGPRYSLCGYDWTYQANPMGEDYKINANCTDGSAGDATSQRTQIQNGVSAWNNAGADFAFTYGGTSTQTSVSNNGTNLIFFSNSPPGGGSYVAATYIWQTGGDITEVDLVFNDRDYVWWNGSGSCSAKMDIWDISAHELGHWLCLADLYGGGDTAKTMYGYVDYCDIHARDLHSDDINGIIAIYGGGGGGYCAAASNSTAYEYISRVQVGSINNSSSSSGYADYTAQSTPMAIGTGYSITVTLGNSYSTDVGGLWVDWNHDQDFADAGETITTAWSGTGPYTTTITPPGGAVLGSTRLRVRIQDHDYDPTLNPCGNTSYGEVEDYSISVISGADTTPPTPNPMTFSSAPAPTSTSAIAMTATTATDGQTPPVQYFFDFVSGGAGGTDSSWQSSTSFTDSGLAPNTAYTYRVKARDSAPTPNETSYSTDATTATHIETPTGITFGTVTANSIELIAGGTYTNLNQGTSGLFFDATTPGGDGGINAWVQTTTDTATGLSPDTSYIFRVTARNQYGVGTSYSPTNSKATLANVPAAPVLTAVDCSSMDLDVAPNGNPSGTTYAIQCTATSPNDPTWQSQYVSAAGGPTGTAEWRTDGTWALVRLTGMQEQTTYTFQVMARNQETVQTALGPAASRTTSRCGDGDMDVDGDIDLYDFAMWEWCFDLTPLEPGCEPGDFDGDGTINLEDYAQLNAVLSGPF